MKKLSPSPLAKSAVLTIAAIKTAIAAFDRGEANAFDALDEILVAVAAYRAGAVAKPRRRSAPRTAA